jgi:hypothetical protein
VRAGWLGLVLAALALPAAAELRAGAAAVEIAVPEDVPLAGYGARGPGNHAGGVLEPVSARALVLEEAPDGARVGLVVLDALIVTPDLREAIGTAGADLALDALVVAATHTHSGPGGYLDDAVAAAAILGWYRPESRSALVEAAQAALRRAAELEPARLRHAAADGADLARNRRHPGGPQDPQVPVLAVDAADGRPLATLFALAAHPTVLGPRNTRLSPDYPGAARRRVEALRGGTAVFLAGPLGDQKPHLSGEPEWPEDLERQAHGARLLGRALGERVADAAAGARPARRPEVRAAVHAWPLPPVDVKASCAYYVGAPLLWAVARSFLPTRTELVALRLGDLRLLASPFELGVEVAADVRAAAGAGPVLVAAHAGDWLGYLLQPADYARGGYEPCLAYHGRDLAPRFVVRSRAALEAVR